MSKTTLKRVVNTGIDSYMFPERFGGIPYQNEKILSRKEHLQICALVCGIWQDEQLMTDCYTIKFSMESLLNELGCMEETSLTLETSHVLCQQ